MKYTIREIQENDFPQLIEIFKEFATFEKLPEKMTNSVEQMLQEKEYINGFVATNENNHIIGYSTYFYSYYTWIGKSIYMDDLYVLKDYRGSGIGSILIQKVIDHAKNTKCRKLRWQVSNWNKPAQEFYKKLGATIDDVEINCDLEFVDKGVED